MTWDPGVIVVTPQSDTKGAMWQKMWERAGIAPSSVQVLPLEDWRPTEPGKRPVPESVHTILTMGEQAMNVVAMQSDLFRWRGRTQAIYNWGLPCTVVSTMRVTELLPFLGASKAERNVSQLRNRPARYQGVWIRDVQYALKQGGVIHRYSDNYLLDPVDRLQWQRYVDSVLSAGQQLSFDIETQYTPKGLKSEEDTETGIAEGAMLRIAFSHGPHTGASVSWQHQYMDGIRALLESDLPKVGWNCLAFDVPKLESEGLRVGGRIRDYQDAWHLLESDLPKGLEWTSSFYTHVAPWKHLSDINLARYAAMDADIALQNALGIERDLRHYGQWDLFERHVTDLMPILRRAGQRGNAIDLEYQAVLRAEMEAEKQRLRDEADRLVPRHVKPRARVATPPATEVDHDVVKVPAKVKTCSICGAEMPNKAAHTKGGKKNPCAKATTVEVDGERPMYDIVVPFNLGSSDQMQAYAKFFNHPLGWNPKTQAVTMDANHIEKLADKYGTNHPIYGAQLEYSKVSKTLSTYMYAPDDLGLIHTSYVNAPSTWRLASRDYNLQNVGKRETNPWAKKARRQIVARPGHVFVQADSTSIEAVVLGVLIDDPEFVRVAKKSIHAYLCCQELKWDFTDDAISRVKKEQKDLYNQFKTAVYLLLYGGDPYLMHMTNPAVFPTVQSAQLIQRKIFKIMPKLEQWQARTREQAKREGVLQTPWGYRHRFYDVYTFKRDDQGNILYDEEGKPKMKMGQDSKRALAFIPQNCAGAFCRDTLVLIGQSKWGQYMPANVSVHDSYCLEVPEELADAAEQFLVNTLTRPVEMLGGVRIGCEVDRGYNWADWSEDNPRGMKVQRKVEV